MTGTSKTAMSENGNKMSAILGTFLLGLVCFY